MDIALLPQGHGRARARHDPDVFHAAILLWAAGLAHVNAGNVDFGLVGNILPAVLRATLAIVLIGAGLALLIKAGLDLPLEVIVPFPVAVMVLLVVTMARARRARETVP